MKRLTLFLILLNILPLKSYAQIIFENGYFIEETGQRTECLIKNIDWKDNPIDFEYKFSENDVVQTATINTVKEFGINGVSKYKRTVVKIDRSSDYVEMLGPNRNPDFAEEQLFLKLLVEGKASLFSYEDGALIRFFYQHNDSVINQLVYKRYVADEYIKENNFFRQQLFLELKCNTLNDVSSLKYARRDLRDFFIKYNECASAPYVDYETAKKRDLFNLTIRPGLNNTRFTTNHPYLDQTNFKFENQINFRFGVEAEFILPFNKNKWSIIAEPTYQYYNAERKTTRYSVSGGFVITKIDYQSIDLPLGIRHYFFLNDDSRIFANISYLFNFRFNSTIDLERIDGSMIGSSEVNPKKNLALGLGYKYKNRYSLELRYISNPGILSKYLVWSSEYRTLSIIFGYTLF